MTEVREPGANNKVASVPVFQTRNFVRLIMNTLPIFFAYFCYPQQLKNWRKRAYSFREATNKI